MTTQCILPKYVLSRDNEIRNRRSGRNIKYIPLGVQRMLVKTVTNHNALHFELLNVMHQTG